MDVIRLGDSGRSHHCCANHSMGGCDRDSVGGCRNPYMVVLLAWRHQLMTDKEQIERLERVVLTLASWLAPSIGIAGFRQLEDMLKQGEKESANG